MKKSDLRNGMVVEVGTNTKYLVLTNIKTELYGKQDFILTNPNGFLVASHYDENMNHENGERFSIIKVYDAPIWVLNIDDIIKDKYPIWIREKNPTYLELHEQSGFKKGHIVRIMKSAHYGEKGWTNNWPDVMDSTINKIGRITEDSHRSGFFVTFNSGDSYWYPYFVLKLVD